jgi:Domain of unknown function (DUF4440)
MNRQLSLLCAVLIATNRMCLAQTDSELSEEPSTAPSATPSTAPVADAGTITDLENSVWKAYKNKQLRSLEGLLYKTYYGVYADGIKTLDMEVADMDKTDIASYSLADIKVEFPNPSIAVITYKTSQRGTFDGKDVSGNYYNESVWVKKGDRWLNTFHTATKAK